MNRDGNELAQPILGANLEARYLAGKTVGEYLTFVRDRFPRLFEDLWFDREGAGEALERLSRTINEFETDENGRGGSYRQAQSNITVRMTGVSQLFKLLTGDAEPSTIGPEWRALDVLGGDGLLARMSGYLTPGVYGGLITGDLAANMVVEALARGLPAIRQDARFLFLRDRTMDGVLIAYGTHHIPRSDRPAVCAEAARVLRPGGRLVIHDFQEGSPSSWWFSEVVHRYSSTGHQYDHFTPDELGEYLHEAGFRQVTVERMYDPFILRAATEFEARAQLSDYVYDMYGLTKLNSPETTQDTVREETWKLVERHFRYDEAHAPTRPVAWRQEPAVYPSGDQWVAEIPRIALVATGQK